MNTYSDRRALLERGPVRLVATFEEEGEALFAAVCERGLEGVAAGPSKLNFEAGGHPRRLPGRP